MRSAAALGFVLVALTAGCGGRSEGTGSPSTVHPARPAPAATVKPNVTDGRLGTAVVARPGHTSVSSAPPRLNPRPVPLPSKRHGVAAEDNCTDADIQPTANNLAHVSDVIFCLMNAMRADNGLPALTEQSQLAQASVEHSQDMVDNTYFAHDSPDGRDVVARLRAVAYIPADGDWVVGENLAWGSGALSTPHSLVNAWMNSPPHRENLLATDYKEVGLGVVYGTPDQSAPDGITVTTDFGTRIGSATTPVASKSTTKTTQKTARSATRCKRRHGAARRRCVRAARSHKR